ncbi:MAG: hypothetical protein RID02_03730 [Gracilimonas sp.]
MRCVQDDMLPGEHPQCRRAAMPVGMKYSGSAKSSAAPTTTINLSTIIEIPL